jgi:hypothetical protein
MHFLHHELRSRPGLLHLLRCELSYFDGIGKPLAHGLGDGHLGRLGQALEGSMHLRRNADGEPDVRDRG